MSAGAPTSLYDLVMASLSASTATRLEELFDGRRLKLDDGRRYRVGEVIRSAWKCETDLAPPVAKDIADIIAAVLEGAGLGAYAAPACCTRHAGILPTIFGDPTRLPPDETFLEPFLQALWANLAHARGVLDIAAARPMWVTLSRFMPLRRFVGVHDRDVVFDDRKAPATISAYMKDFAADLPLRQRKANLRRRIARDELKGMVGAYPELDPRSINPPHYCGERRPFATPSPTIGAVDRAATPPEEMLRKMGLQFSSGDTIVELVYRAKIVPPGTPKAPSAPTVVDCEGYWLFRPDRNPRRVGRLRWNYTRDVATDGRGSRELIAPSIEVRSLTDLIIWKLPTAVDWTNGAAACLSADLQVP